MRVMMGAEVPSATNTANNVNTSEPRNMKYSRLAKGGWVLSVGMRRNFKTNSPSPPPRNTTMNATRNWLMPRSVKECTEKSASTPLRVKNVEYVKSTKGSKARNKLSFLKIPRF